MIKDLSEAIRKLINSLSVRPLATLTAVFIISVAFVGFKSYAKLEKLIITPEQEALRFQQQLESAKLINQGIEGLKERSGAKLVIVAQFHNGRHDLTGIPFTESTDTFYTDNYEGSGEHSLSSMNNSLRRMWERIDTPTCLVINSPIDTSSKNLFTSYELETLITCPVTNLLHYPIGLVQVGFSRKLSIQEAARATESTSTISRSIAGYLRSD